MHVSRYVLITSGSGDARLSSLLDVMARKMQNHAELPGSPRRLIGMYIYSAGLLHWEGISVGGERGSASMGACVACKFAC